MAASWFPHWTTKTDGVIAPDERLPWPQTDRAWACST